MAHHTFETDAKCRACKGSGVYVAMDERDGAGVVCSRCTGRGHLTLKVEWDDFEGREVKEGVKRIYRANPGIGEDTGRGLSLQDFGGMPYEDWQQGLPWPPQSEDRKHTCPAWWYQGVDYDLKPRWDFCGCGTFSSCKHFPAKGECWGRWDKENLSG